jgi:hypothetical protein
VAQKIPAYPLNPQSLPHLDLRLRRYLRDDVVLCYLCHLCHIRQRFAETFGVGVFFGGFPKTPKRFGVFDIPKSVGLVWWIGQSRLLKQQRPLVDMVGLVSVDDRRIISAPI